MASQSDRHDRYQLRCLGCDARFPPGEWILHCPACARSALLRAEYAEPLELAGEKGQFASFAPWLPYENTLKIAGPSVAVQPAARLGSKIGLNNLWVIVSGYAPALGAVSESGTFKECEAIGVLNRVHEQTDKVLIISSAGNAGKAFLEWGAKLGQPVIVVLPEQAEPALRNACEGRHKPLMILIKDAHYPDAIKFVDIAIERFADELVREGGCYNVARRDSMAVPFLNAAMSLGRLPDWYVQAVGSGTGAIAAWESALRLHSSGVVASNPTRMLLVQNAPFAPMVEAWQAGAKEIRSLSDAEVRDSLSQVVASVLSNATPPYSVKGGVYDVLQESRGEMVAVRNDDVRAAQALVAECMDFVPCDAASAATAGLIDAVRSGIVGADDEVVLHLTGGGFAALAGAAPATGPERFVTGLNNYDAVLDEIGRYLGALKAGDHAA
jgi:cysteate synthase